MGRHHRLAEEIMGLRQRQQGAMPRPCRKRVWASVREDMKKVLVDGHEEQLRQIGKAVQRYGVKVKVVQDFIHVLEKLWEAAWCLHPEGSEDAER